LSSLRPPPTTTLFPYTTLFRSSCSVDVPTLRRPSAHHLRSRRRATAVRGDASLVEHAPGMVSGLGAYDVGPVTIRSSLDVNTLRDRKSTRLNSSHVKISYAVFC